MSKKPKMTKAFIVFLIFFLFFFSLPIIYVVVKEKNTPPKLTVKEELMNIGYSISDADYIMTKKDIKEYALKNEYNEKLVELSKVEEFDITLFGEYTTYQKEYQDAPNEAVIYLINKGVTYPYSERLYKLSQEKYFINELAERYVVYKSENTLETVTNVNCNLDYAYYTNTLATDTSKNELMLVNKYYYLDSNFNGADIVPIQSGYSSAGGSLARVAHENFINLVNSARAEGYSILARSPYRSYGTQLATYNGWVSSHGFQQAETFSARAGHSEHQTGYAVDVTTPAVAQQNLGAFEYTKEFTWMANNAHKFGFILRFPNGKSNITGYIYEPWHYRYVGVDAAKQIKEENLTLEEYYAYYIKYKKDTKSS